MAKKEKCFRDTFRNFCGIIAFFEERLLNDMKKTPACRRKIIVVVTVQEQSKEGNKWGEKTEDEVKKLGKKLP